jgi:hypothetical protein
MQALVLVAYWYYLFAIQLFCLVREVQLLPNFMCVSSY